MTGYLIYISIIIVMTLAFSCLEGDTKKQSIERFIVTVSVYTTLYLILYIYLTK